MRPPAALTWGEAKRLRDESKVRYRVYAHDRPITAASLHEATLVGEAGPLSAWNVNARNKEYLIGQAMARPDEMGELGNAMVNVHRSDFHVTHPIAARSDPQRCSSCHEPGFCQDCHAAVHGSNRDPLLVAMMPPLKFCPAFHETAF